MVKVMVRLPPHIAQMLNPKLSSWLELEEEVKDRTTVNNLLSYLVTNYPGFRETVYNPNAGEISDQIGVVLNDRLLTYRKITHTILKDNDVITIVPLYYGG